MIKTGIIGVGPWGKTLSGKLQKLPAFNFCYMHDAVRPQTLPDGVAFVDSFEEFLSLTDMQAVVLATPADTHATIAKKLLAAGKDVLVAKPLAINPVDCEELTDMATATGRVLVTGHTTLFHPGILELRELVKDRVIHRVTTVRRGVGRIQRNSVIDDLAVHDIANLLFITGSSVTESSHSYFSHGAAPKTAALMFMKLENGVRASVDVSWTAEQRTRETIVAGDGFLFRLDELSNTLSLYRLPSDAELKAGVAFSAEKTNEHALSQADILEEELNAFAQSVSNRLGRPDNLRIATDVIRVIATSKEIM